VVHGRHQLLGLHLHLEMIACLGDPAIEPEAAGAGMIHTRTRFLAVGGDGED
jgi:hypothetical protein